MIDVTRRALLAKRMAEVGGVDGTAPCSRGPVRRADPDRAVLTDQQLISWRHQLDHPTSTINNLGLFFDCGLGVESPRLITAIEGFVELHELLRTTYSYEAGESWQNVHTHLLPRIDLIDIGSSADPGRMIDEQVRSHLADPFDLSSQGPLRAVVFGSQTGHATSLLLVIHHIIWDARCFDVLTRDLQDLVHDHGGRRAPDRLHYGDYAQWCSQQPADRREQALEYWTRHLEALPRPPLRRPDTTVEPIGESGARHDRRMRSDAVAGLRDLARRNATTHFVAFIAVLGRLLAARAGTTEVCIGTLMSLRERPAVHNMLGDFAVLTPIRFETTGDLSTTIASADTAFRGALEHGHVGYRAIAQHVDKVGTAARPTAFDVVVVFIEGELTGPQFGPTETTWQRVDNGCAQFPIVPLGVEVFLRSVQPEIQFTFSPEVVTERLVTELAEDVLANLEVQK